MILDRHDRIALKLAMEKCCALGREREDQIAAMLEDRSWVDVAEFAARVCQMESLHLEPWRMPPACVSETGDGFHDDPDAVALLRKMLAAGVSRYDPSPLTALEAAKAKGRG
jgi:hypothetical protein